MKTKKLIVIFSVMLALFVTLSVCAFADDTDAVVVSAANDAVEDAADAVDNATDTVLEDAEKAADAVDDAVDGAVPTVGAEDTDAVSVDEEAAAEAADSVIATLDTGDEAAETGTWSNLGTSGIIGIIVAIVILVAAIIVIVLLIPKKNGVKKK